ncbi:hypothetical protein PHMEG_0004583 [Phytophthora megakarya]|uniref:Uncharacterized protein n=1 Tax=Phytophthora megakarya TaxID=4795 RepID=A0A225WV53_9STRA|nr:hypothetical protein PHMEG_0004583 [Phytophthora megakarya]
MQVPPTLCRPRHLDPERLRARLGADKFEKLRYHEAAVVSTAPMRFQLFALSSDTLFIVPLMGRGEAAADMSLSLWDISSVERVVPENKKQRGLLLLPTSQVFRLQLREVPSKKIPSELFFSTFEPQTQLFFQLSRALRVDFQMQLIPQLQISNNTPSRIEQRLELSRLLEMFAMDLVRACDDGERINLLKELTTAAYSSNDLRQLFFDDRTQIQGCTGLAVYLIRQLSYPLRRNETSQVRMEYLLSVARLLSIMCFDMQLRTSCLNKLSLNDLVRNLLARGAESYATSDKTKDDLHVRVSRENFMDIQASLLLALDGMQQNEDFRLHQHQQMRGLLIERPTSVMQQALRAPALPEWLPKFFKRVCIAISRAAIAIERQHELENVNYHVDETDEGDDSDCREALEPAQILALWRCVTVLELLVKSDVASGTYQILEVLLHTRKDCIDMYLRTPRFIALLSASGMPHLEDIALKLNKFLDSLRDRRRR